MGVVVSVIHLSLSELSGLSETAMESMACGMVPWAIGIETVLEQVVVTSLSGRAMQRRFHDLVITTWSSLTNVSLT